MLVGVNALGDPASLHWAPACDAASAPATGSRLRPAGQICLNDQRLFSLEKIRCRHLQCFREPREISHAEIVASLLDIRDVGPFDLGGVREVLLGPPARQAEATNSLAKFLEKGVGGRGHPASSGARSDQVHGKSATFNGPKMPPYGGQSRVAPLDRSAGRALHAA